MDKKIITQEDLDKYPDLAEQGVKVGDEAEIPDSDNEENGDDVGGSNPPPDKPRPPRP